MQKLPENASPSRKSTLTEDQLRRIEENRRKALERLQQRQTGSPAALRHNLQHTPGPKSVERGSFGYQAPSSTRTDSNIIAKRVEEKRARALERLKSRQNCSDVGQVSQKGTSNCNQFSFGGSSNNSMRHISRSLSPTSTVSDGRTDLLTWSDQFSYQRQSAISSQQKQSSNEPKKSKELSLIGKINEGSIDQMQVFARSSLREDHSASQTTAARHQDGPTFQMAFILLNPKRFEVQCKFNVDVIGVFKTMVTKIYDTKKKTWNFSLTEHDELISKLRLLNQPLKLDQIPPKVINILKELSEKEKQSESIDLSKIGDSLIKTLFPFQEQGVRYGVRNNGRLLIADDMGLGKTIQAITLALYYRSDWPLLVIAPSSIKVSWAKEFMNRIPSLKEDHVRVIHTGKDDPTAGLVNILSYDLVPKHLDVLKRKHFRVIIADESHFIKNSKAARTKAAMALLKQAARVILLSGTPALSRPMELYNQIFAVNPKLFPSFHAYALRYCDAKKNAFGWDYSGSSNLEELRIILESKIMIRRLKNDVLDQLPEKQRRIVILDPSSINTKSVCCEARKLEVSSGKEKRLALLQYFSATSEAKTKAVLEYISDFLEGEAKFILFGHHQVILNAISQMLHKKKVSFIRIDGSTTANARQSLVEKFQNDEDCLVAVLSITAANTGLNLTVATTVIFAELYWNPGALVQAEDRIYRIGQKNAVTITYLIAENTADDYMWPLIQNKLDVLTSAGLSQREFTPEVSKFKDPKQKRILDFFHDLMECDHLMEKSHEEEIKETEPARKRIKAD